MSSTTDNDSNFKAQSYLRLLKYTLPYWKRLTFGILCGMLVGGSLFFALLLVPQLVGLVDSGGNIGASADQRTVSAEELGQLREIAADQNIDDAEKDRRMEEVLSFCGIAAVGCVLFLGDQRSVKTGIEDIGMGIEHSLAPSYTSAQVCLMGVVLFRYLSSCPMVVAVVECPCRTVCIEGGIQGTIGRKGGELPVPVEPDCRCHTMQVAFRGTGRVGEEDSCGASYSL